MFLSFGWTVPLTLKCWFFKPLLQKQKLTIFRFKLRLQTRSPAPIWRLTLLVCTQLCRISVSCEVCVIILWRASLAFSLLQNAPQRGAQWGFEWRFSTIAASINCVFLCLKSFLNKRHCTYTSERFILSTPPQTEENAQQADSSAQIVEIIVKIILVDIHSFITAVEGSEYEVKWYFLQLNSLRAGSSSRPLCMINRNQIPLLTIRSALFCFHLPPSSALLSLWNPLYLTGPPTPHPAVSACPRFTAPPPSISHTVLNADTCSLSHSPTRATSHFLPHSSAVSAVNPSTVGQQGRCHVNKMLRWCDISLFF